jgi:malonyl-CoA O-methyltransferase
MSIALSAVLPERTAARRAFARAAGFDAACFVHDEARRRLLERVDILNLAPRTVVDLGTATGRAAAELAVRFPAARVLAVDSCAPMLAAACARAPGAPAIAADAEQLPFGAQTVDLLFANLVLPWCSPQAVFAEAARVLRSGGALLFSTLGPDSLAEVRRAFGAVDKEIHVHAAFDLHDLGDWALAAGLGEPVLDVDRLTITYGSVADLVRDLKAVGGTNTAAGRRRTLTGRRRYEAFVDRLAGGRERFSVTAELVLGIAWGREPPRSRRLESGEIAVPLERIGRSSGNT